MTGSGREALPDIREWPEVPPGWSSGSSGCPEVVGSPSRMTGSGQEALQNVREYS